MESPTRPEEPLLFRLLDERAEQIPCGTVLVGIWGSTEWTESHASTSIIIPLADKLCRLPMRSSYLQSQDAAKRGERSSKLSTPSSAPTFPPLEVQAVVERRLSDDGVGCETLLGIVHLPILAIASYYSDSRVFSPLANRALL